MNLALKYFLELWKIRCFSPSILSFPFRRCNISSTHFKCLLKRELLTFSALVLSVTPTSLPVSVSRPLSIYLHLSVSLSLCPSLTRSLTHSLPPSLSISLFPHSLISLIPHPQNHFSHWISSSGIKTAPEICSWTWAPSAGSEAVQHASLQNWHLGNLSFSCLPIKI